MKYQMIGADSNTCPDCGRHVDILIDTEGDGPHFYICFQCRYVGHVGSRRIPAPAPDRLTEGRDYGYLLTLVSRIDDRLHNLRDPLSLHDAAEALYKASWLARQLCLKGTDNGRID